MLIIIFIRRRFVRMRTAPTFVQPTGLGGSTKVTPLLTAMSYVNKAS